MKKTYFVYWYRNPLKNGEIFYVGYGDHKRKCGGCRAYDHLNEVRKGIMSSNRHKFYTIKEILESGKIPIIEIVADDLDKNSAVLLEKKLRSEYRDTLTNIAEGGDGGDTFTNQPEWKKNIIRRKLRNKLPTVHSEEWIEKLSKERKGKGNPFYGKKHAKKTKQLCGAVWRGKKIPKELVNKRQKLSVYYVETPDSGVLELKGRTEFGEYFRKLNENKKKSDKINWQYLLKKQTIKGYRIFKVESVKKSEIIIYENYKDGYRSNRVAHSAPSS